MWGVLAVVYFAAAVASHAALCRLPLPVNNVAKFLLVGGMLGLALGGHEMLLQGPAMETWTALLMYAFMSELYIFVFTLEDSSVSVSLLIALRARSLTQGQIDRFCGSTEMVDRRIEKLVATGLLGVSTAGYFVTDKGMTLVVVFKTLRHFFRHTVGMGPAGGTGQG